MKLVLFSVTELQAYFCDAQFILENSRNIDASSRAYLLLLSLDREFSRIYLYTHSSFYQLFPSSLMFVFIHAHERNPFRDVAKFVMNTSLDLFDIC